MNQAIRQQVIVQAGGRIEVYAPELKPGTRADVIILETAEPPIARSLLSLIGAGAGSFASPEAVDAFLRSERDAWE